MIYFKIYFDRNINQEYSWNIRDYFWSFRPIWATIFRNIPLIVLDISSNISSRNIKQSTVGIFQEYFWNISDYFWPFRPFWATIFRDIPIIVRDISRYISRRNIKQSTFGILGTIFILLNRFYRIFHKQFQILSEILLLGIYSWKYFRNIVQQFYQ